MESFMKLPGVQDLGNGQFRYPASLTPPAAPKAPISTRDEMLHRVALFPELGDGGIDFFLAEGIDRQALHDLPFTIGSGADGH